MVVAPILPALATNPRRAHRRELLVARRARRCALGSHRILAALRLRVVAAETPRVMSRHAADIPHVALVVRTA
jgi:hypothetical protein